ncbi:MAG: type II toxin-antitoxin system Phd/YefM family antitoxin [Anaerolineae bacterium]|nr:type II toxin-antitoxin system Phd/YefM family antitoxin [Anaerolineae bacterium]
MRALTVAEAKTKLFQLIEEVADSHDPILITGKQANRILLSEEDWQAIEETLYLLNVPEMRESIVAGLNTSLAKCDDEIWRI